nr:DegV family protein [bacterium]
MNNKIAIITDSACDLTTQQLETLNIYMIPLRIIYGDTQYRDRLDITPEEVYARMPEEVPTTSLPSEEDIQNVFDRAYADGCREAIVITLSSGLSGTFNRLRLFAQAQDRLTVHMMDTRILSMGEGLMVLEAARARDEGLDAPAILERLEQMRAHKLMGLYVIRTLEYLRKGGRIGKVEGTIGTLLHIKPVIGMTEDGVYTTITKAISYSQALQRMQDEFRKRYEGKSIRLAIVHGSAQQEAERFSAVFPSFCNVVERFLMPIGPALGIHTGPGLVGAIACEV